MERWGEEGSGARERGEGSREGDSQLVPDRDEGDEEEGAERADVLDRELLLVRVREGEVLSSRESGVSLAALHGGWD